MKTMRNASFVLLLGVAALTQIAHASDDKKSYYIITPTTMTAEATKASNIHMEKGFLDAEKKVAKFKIEVEEAVKAEQKAQTALDDIDALITKARDDPTAKVTEATQEVADKENQVVAKAAEITDAKKVPDGESDGDKTTRELQVKALEEQKKTLEEQRTELQQTEKDCKDFKAKADSKWDTKKDEKDRTWFKEQVAAVKTRDAKRETVTKKRQRECYQKAGPKDDAGKAGPEVDDEAKGGGLMYWEHLRDTHMAQAERSNGLQAFETAFPELEVVGFMGDAQKGTELLVRSKETKLEVVQKMFDARVDETDNNPAEDYKIAQVKAADVKDKDKASVTVDKFIRVANGVEHIKNHRAQITTLEVRVETVHMTRVKLDDDKKTPKMKSVTGADGKKKQEEDKTSEYPKKFLNFQRLHANVYVHLPTANPTTEPFVVARASDDYEVAGDSANMIAAADTEADTDKAKDADAKKESGTNGWMIVGIICLIVIFLGGAIIAYRAYTASGSAQNTDL